MSINKNLLVNNTPAVLGTNSPTEVNLVTTSGSRWVMIDFLNTIPTGSGGLCQGVTLEWSPDPSMVTNPFQPSSSYYAVTSSVLSCASASLSPMTGSEGWVQFINSYYQTDPETPAGIPLEYYVRAYQSRVNSPVNFYSPVVPVQTRAIQYCGRNGGDGFVADIDGWNSPLFPNKWQSDYPGNVIVPGTLMTASISVAPTHVKAGGPNYDALKTNGATISWPTFGTYTNSTVVLGYGIVTGSVTSSVTASNGVPFNVFVEAIPSTTATSGVVVKHAASGTVVSNIILTGSSTINSLVEFEFVNQGGNIYMDGANVGVIDTAAYTADGQPWTLSPNFVTATSANAIVRNFHSKAFYTSSLYHCKYGPVGASSYVG